MLTYIFIIFLRNSYHIHSFSGNSLACVNVLHTHLLTLPGGHQGSSDEASYSSSQCPPTDHCFCANSVLGSPCPSGLVCCGLVVSLQLSYLCSSAHPLSQGWTV